MSRNTVLEIHHRNKCVDGEPSSHEEEFLEPTTTAASVTAICARADASGTSNAALPIARWAIQDLTAVTTKADDLPAATTTGAGLIIS